MQSGKLGASAAYELARLRDTARQVELGEKLVAGQITRPELTLLLKQGTKAATRKVKVARVAVRFELAGGFEPLEQKLAAMLADVTRLKKNSLPPDLLAGMWAEK